MNEKQAILEENTRIFDQRVKEMSEQQAYFGIPKIYHEAWIDEKFEEEIIDFLSGETSQLFVNGVVGSGKSYLLWATVREYHRREGNTWGAYDMTTLARKIRASATDFELSEKLIKELTTIKCLFIDDLGAEKTSEWVTQDLQEIIDKRLANGKSLFITSNLELKDIDERYGARIASRLASGECIRLEDKDRRIKND